MDRLIPLEDRSSWETTLAGVPHAFAHTWDNCYAMALSTGYPTYLYCHEDAAGKIVCPIAERTFEGHVDVVTPYGFSGFVGSAPTRDFARVWCRFATSRRYVAGYFVLNPVLSDGNYFAGSAVRHRTAYVLDLSLGEDVLFFRLSTNRKRQVKKAVAGKTKFVLDRDRLTPFFLAVYRDFMRRRQASSIYDMAPEALAVLAESDRVVMIGAEERREIVAVSLFGMTEHCGDFLYNVSLPGKEGHSTGLIWGGVQQLIANRVPFLNLGGGVAEGDSVAQFKERFGGHQRPLLSLRQVYRPTLYQLLCQRAGVEHHDRNGYFPAYRSAGVIS